MRLLLWFFMVSFNALTLEAANVDFAMSDLGNCAIENLEKQENISYTEPVLFAAGGVALFGGCGLAVPLSVCLTNSGWASCFLSGLFGGTFGGVGGVACFIASFCFGANIRQNKPHQKFAHLLRQAYIAQNESGSRQKDAYKEIERFLAEQEPNYKVKYANIPRGPIKVLAEQLVLANEAGHCSAWTILFPEKQDLSLEAYQETLGAPKFNFSFCECGSPSLSYLNTDDIKLLSCDELLNSTRADYLSKTILLKQIKELKAVTANYEKKLADKKGEATKFLEQISGNLIDIDYQ